VVRGAKNIAGRKYLSVKEKWNTLKKDKKLREKTLAENIISYLSIKGWPH